MLGTKFELDNDKLIALGYDPQEFELKIDEVAQKIGLIKVGKCEYHGDGSDKELGDLGAFCWDYLEENNLFAKSVKSWLWLSDEEESNNDNLIIFLKRKKARLWQ